jgi:hypothetical protein
MAKRKKGQTMIIKIVHRKQKIEQYEPYLKMEVNSGSFEPNLAEMVLKVNRCWMASDSKS